MTQSSAVRTSLGRTLRLGKQIGSGGEGIVYEVANEPDLAAKLYLSGIAAHRQEKVTAMVAAGWHQSVAVVAFPYEVLFAPTGEFIGFAMRRVGGHKPIHQLYSPASRKNEFSNASFPFLVHAALNVARAVAIVHNTGCIIGDVNHSGILVSDTATATLIDSDSFQVPTPGQAYLCHVGVPEFTPPELQGARLDQTRRTTNHDAFGLAVLIFQLLFMGRHPFAGRYSGKGEMPLQRAIAEFRFAYSLLRSDTNMEPPPGAPLLADFPTYLSDAFERAFSRAGARDRRPPAAEWVSLLERLKAELVVCTANRAHHHVRAKSCPWCRMEQFIPGFIPFSPNQLIRVIPTSVNVSQLLAMISAARDPGPPPPISSIIILPRDLAPSPAALRAQWAKWRNRALGLVGSLAGAVFMFFADQAAVLGLLVIGGSIVAAFRTASGIEAFRDARRRAETEWSSAQETWKRQSGNKRFLELKAEANSFINSFKGLPEEEKRRLEQLQQNKRDAQLTRFLAKYYITRARIPKVGSARKATLASYGIETAADVVRRRIEGVPGFGPHLAAHLLAWRQVIEQRFKFYPNEPVNPADIKSVHTDIARMRADLEARVRKSVAALQQAANDAMEQRKRLTATTNATFRRLKQAEIDEEIATRPIGLDVGWLKKHAWAMLTAGVALILLIAFGQYTLSLTGSSASFRSSRPTISTDGSLTTRSSSGSHSGNINEPSVAPMSVSPEIPKSATGESAGSAPARPGNEATPTQSTSVPAFASPLDDPSGPGERATRAEPATPSIPSTLRLVLFRPDDVRRIQQRLIDLGFLSGVSDGVWGPRSQRALRDFRLAQGWADGGWDERTELQLFSASMAR
jgi:DNA-binding helix-hairpin-helix protein with protein kinase domain